jgi:hypothetical protein
MKATTKRDERVKKMRGERVRKERRCVGTYDSTIIA